MKRAFLAIAVALVACTGFANPTDEAIESLGIPSRIASRPEQELLEGAAEFNHAELELAALGKTSSDPHVRALAERLEKNHQALQPVLDKMAKQKGLTLPATPSGKQSEQLADLKKKQPRDFNPLFLKTAAQFHQEALQLFQKNAPLIDDPALRTFAGQLLKGAQVNLNRIQATPLEPVAEPPRKRWKRSGWYRRPAGD